MKLKRKSVNSSHTTYTISVIQYEIKAYIHFLKGIEYLKPTSTYNTQRDKINAGSNWLLL